jgi:MFS family permease
MSGAIFRTISNFFVSGQLFVSLKSRNYRFFFTGQGISLIGSWMQSIAMSWLVYRLTGSKMLLGVVGFSSQIPSFILSPIAGVITDRFNRKQLMLFAQVLFMLHAILLGLLVLSETIQIWHIILLSLVFGFISAFDAPARQSLVVDLIDKPQNLGNAIALNSALFNSARLIGPAVAGIVIAVAGEGICFLINALSYIAIIVALIKIKITKRQDISRKLSFKKQFVEGFKYTFGYQPIRSMLFLLAVVSLFGVPFATLMPAYAIEILDGNSHTYGFLMSATGAGALSGAVFLASRKSTAGLPTIIALTTLAFGICLIALSQGKYYLPAIISGFCAGFCMISAIASINTLIQTMADEAKRGRVMSFYAMALMGMTPFGSLLAGSMGTAFGISLTLLVNGVLTVMAGIWFVRKWRRG